MECRLKLFEAVAGHGLCRAISARSIGVKGRRSIRGGAFDRETHACFTDELVDGAWRLIDRGRLVGRYSKMGTVGNPLKQTTESRLTRDSALRRAP
jgi:hypothetical protein